jgi:hypothetical protein
MATSPMKLAHAARADPIVELLREVLAGQRVLNAKVDVLLARLAVGPRDAGDVALVQLLATVSGGDSFTAAAVFRRRNAGDEALATALETCDIENPVQLGKLLKRLEGHDVGGVWLACLGANREGAIWVTRVQG